MDIRPLIHLWLNKPDAYGGRGYDTANMKQSVFTGDTYRSNGKSIKTWGNDYSMLDVWLDIDRAISKMNKLERDMLLVYVNVVLTRRGRDWEAWPQPHLLVRAHLSVIAYDILQEGKE